MYEVKCKECGKYFKITPSRYKLCKNLFCCKECYLKYINAQEKVICDYCGKEFYRNKGEIKKAKYHYCSMECKYKDSIGENDIIQHDDFIEILCNYKNMIMSVYIDKEDYEKITNKIHIYKKEKDTTFYAKHKNTFLHRIIMNCPENMVVDHINHNGLDNRKSNLRTCTIKENNRNRQIGKKNTSGYIGVYWSKKLNKWKAELEKDNKSYHGGYFDKKEDAVNARKNLEKLYW
mgnify:CR=1 FL=1